MEFPCSFPLEGDNWVSHRHLIYLATSLNKNNMRKQDHSAHYFQTSSLGNNPTSKYFIITLPASKNFCLSGCLWLHAALLLRLLLPLDTATGIKLFFLVSSNTLTPRCWAPGPVTQWCSFFQGIYNYIDCLNIFLAFILKLKVFHLPSLPLH